jgi:hypothetical protein
MSARNGDKARFNRLRQQKIARRQRMRALRSRLFQGQQAGPTQETSDALRSDKVFPARDIGQRSAR